MTRPDRKETEDKEFVHASHALVANFSWTWMISARQLLNSASILRSKLAMFGPDGALPTDPGKLLAELGVWPVVLMLRGMAVECWLRALWTGAGNRVAANGQIFDLKTHDLEALAKAVLPKAVGLSADQLQILKMLSVAIELGRYPVVRKEKAPFGPVPTSSPNWSSEAERAFEQLMLLLVQQWNRLGVWERVSTGPSCEIGPG